jgi:hypothetical protein
VTSSSDWFGPSAFCVRTASFIEPRVLEVSFPAITSSTVGKVSKRSLPPFVCVSQRKLCQAHWWKSQSEAKG